jgi:hypothetical protein
VRERSSNLIGLPPSRWDRMEMGWVHQQDSPPLVSSQAGNDEKPFVGKQQTDNGQHMRKKELLAGGPSSYWWVGRMGVLKNLRLTGVICIIY